MSWPIVIATNGYGIPVTESANGTPVEIAANGYGTPVVFVESGGLPVAGGALAPYGVSGARVAAIGDSIVAALATSPSPWYNTLSDILSWANVLSGSRLFFVQGGNKAVGGQASGTIAARFTTDLSPLAPRIIFADGGINDDPATVTSATILANWDSMIAQATAMGAIIIALPVLAASNASPGEITRRDAVNAGLLARASATFKVVDITGYDFATMAYAENGAFGPAGVRIHPNILGAQFLGARIATILQTLAGTGSPLLAPTDPANLFPYGAMAGTGGSFDGTGSGSIASNWQIDTNAAGGATVTASKVTDAAGDWQQFVLSGTYTGNSRAVLLTSGYDFAGGSIDAQYETALEMQISGAVKVDAVGVLSYLYNADYSQSAFSSLFQNNVANNSGGYDIPDTSGIFRVMPVSAPGVVPAHGRIFVSAYLREAGSGTAVALTVRVRKVSLKKLAALAPGKMVAPSVAAGANKITITRSTSTPANGAQITGYEYQISSDNGSTWGAAVAMTTNPQDATGLTNGQPYRVRTRANNSAGNGTWSEPSASVTPQWTPAALFAGGEDGAWYEFDDLATMFQDTAGSTPVTATGQPVGRILDKSGKGRHWVAADSATKRPTINWSGSGPRYLTFDGSDDEGEATGITGGILFVAMAPSVVTGSASYAVAARFSANGDNLGLQRNSTNLNWRTDGPGTLNFNTTGMRINGVASRTFVIDAQNVLTMDKTGTGTATVIHLGNNTPGVDRFSGRFYGALIALSRALTAPELALVESYVAGKAGVTF